MSNEDSNEQHEVPPEAEPATEVTPAPIAVVAEMKTVEEWATAKKMLPQFVGGDEARIPGGAPIDGAGSARVAMSGLHGPRMNPNFVRFARARVQRQWPESKEVTEADFDAAVIEAESHVCR